MDLHAVEAASLVMRFGLNPASFVPELCGFLLFPSTFNYCPPVVKYIYCNSGCIAAVVHLEVTFIRNSFIYI